MADSASSTSLRLALLAGGIVALVAAPALAPPFGWSSGAFATGVLLLVMVVWWSAEPVPLAVTALLPMIALPAYGVVPFAGAAAPFADPLVFLLLGGSMAALATGRWGLHRRFASMAIALFGTAPDRLVLGMMAATAFVSLWINNTATALLMLPVALSVAEFAGAASDQRQRANLGGALVMGTAYAAAIGGMGTIIGTPPNGFAVAWLGERGIAISFAAWSLIALPVVALFLPLGWLILVRLIYPLVGTAPLGAAVRSEMAGGPLSSAEWRVGMIFVVTALAWMLRPVLITIPALAHLSDAGIAIAAALAMFMIPAGGKDGATPILTWAEARTLPWDMLLLIGGGLSLANGMDASGLSAALTAGLDAVPPAVLIPVLIAGVILLSEAMSNTAAVVALLPLAGAAGTAALVPVALAIALAASAGFMLPVATPPNGLAVGTGLVRPREMLWAGLLFNIVAGLLIFAAVTGLAPLVLAPR